LLRIDRSWNSIHPCLRFSILRNVGFHFFRPASDYVLGLGLRDWKPVASDIPESIRVLLGERAQAREAKDWAKADEIRKMLNARGWRVEDGNDGQRLIEIATPSTDI
ncbi:CysS/YqeB C-terminal domain-containing protein, partial [Burkholderia vietnamiensis]|uniref:CysS/YqeB C-terminal domain-containing protein n=1 Tax=Burkholderia vietnamiensis TaxID=60552 RepID=UPI003C7AD05C